MALDHERFEIYQAAPELFDLTTVNGKRKTGTGTGTGTGSPPRNPNKNQVVKFFTMRPLLAPNF
jgi:hypothetical protein